MKVKTFSKETFAFLDALAANNRRDWFDANRDRFEAVVLAPARAFVAALGARVRRIEARVKADAESRNGRGSIFRIQRDTRFSKDQAPYKANLGMLFWIEQKRPKRLCPHFYVGLYPGHVLIHAGLSGLTGPLLARFRSAVARPDQGPRLTGILHALESNGFAIGPEHFRRVPSPYGENHPLASLLRRDGASAELRLPAAAALQTDFVGGCEIAFRSSAPLIRWLADTMEGVRL